MLSVCKTASTTCLHIQGDGRAIRNEQDLMRKRLTAVMREYWGWFGADRFTRQDLWRRFEGQYRHAGGQDPWPRDDFIQWLKLAEHRWIIPAPGPRGGEGWRLSEDLVEAFRVEMQACSQIQARAKEHIDRINLSMGKLEVVRDFSNVAGWKIIRSFKPPVPIAGHDVDGKSRPDPTDVFVFSVSAETKSDILRERVKEAERHIKRLIAQERCRVTGALEALDILAAQIEQST